MPPPAMGTTTAADSASRKAKRSSSAQSDTDAVFQRRLPDSAEGYDWLSGQQAPEEEAQAVVVSVFLSFVPFQILKWTERHVETYLYKIQRIIAQDSPYRLFRLHQTSSR
jgi:hypothetical protein